MCLRQMVLLPARRIRSVPAEPLRIRSAVSADGCDPNAADPLRSDVVGMRLFRRMRMVGS